MTAAPPRSWGRDPAALVLAFLAVLLVVVFALGGLLIWRDHDETLARAETMAASAAHTAAEHARWLVQATLLVLDRVDRGLGDDPGTRFDGSVGNLDEAIADLPGHPAVFVTDGSGMVVLSTDPSATPSTVAETDFFAAIEGGDPWDISPLLLGDLIADEKVFVISRRIDRDGFIGVAGVIFPAQQFAEFWTSLALGKDSSVGLVRSDGWLVDREPVPDTAINLANGMLFTALQTAPSGFYHSARSPADGIARIVGYYTVPGLPLVTIAGVSIDTALERYWQRVTLLLAFGIPLILALIGFAWWLTVVLRRERRRSNELAEALEQNETLMAEIHHRVKNNLQLVASLVRLQPGTPEAKQELTRRIAAVSAVHEQIYSGRQFKELDVTDYLRRIVEALRASYGSNATVSYDIEPVRADVAIAFPLALIVSEVVSNAFKHAFGPDGDGVLTIAAHPADGELRLVIRDTGKGFDPDAVGTGFGMKLLRSLSEQIGASYRFVRERGMSFELTVPLTPRLAE